RSAVPERARVRADRRRTERRRTAEVEGALADLQHRPGDGIELEYHRARNGHRLDALAREQRDATEGAAVCKQREQPRAAAGVHDAAGGRDAGAADIAAAEHLFTGADLRWDREIAPVIHCQSHMRSGVTSAGI